MMTPFLNVWARFNACSTTIAQFDPFDEVHEPTRNNFFEVQKKQLKKGKYGLPDINCGISKGDFS